GQRGGRAGDRRALRRAPRTRRLPARVPRRVPRGRRGVRGRRGARAAARRLGRRRARGAGSAPGPVTKLVPPRLMGTASGVVNFFCLVGGLVVPVVLGYALDLTGSFRTAFAACAAFEAVAL